MPVILYRMISLFFQLTFAILIPSSLCVIQILIIIYIRKLGATYRPKKWIYKVYCCLDYVKTVMLGTILFLDFLLVDIMISYVIIYCLSIIFFYLGVDLIDIQYDFMVFTLALVCCVPFSIILIKFFTRDELRKNKKEKSPLAIAYLSNYLITLFKKIPIKELVNVFYVFLLIVSSVMKLANGESAQVIEQSAIFMSFVIYLAIYTACDEVYEKYSDKFNWLEQKLFPIDKEKEKELEQFPKVLKKGKEVIRKLIEDGIPPNNNDIPLHFGK